LFIEINGQKIALNHYPLKTWEGIEDGVWLLHGHEHSKYKDFEFGKWLDLDWGRFMKPLSFDEIKEIMDSREISLNTQIKSH
jgi:calcineurin-like phosphoesterase family protein